MEQEVFKFHIQNLSYGWCRVLMLINNKEIYYNASYLGVNPLSSMIEACADLIEEGGKYYISWERETGTINIDLELDDEGMLHFDILNDIYDDENQEEWHESIPFKEFVSSIKSEAFRVLNAFGLRGFWRSWQNEVEFPLVSLLRICGKYEDWWNGDSCCSDIIKEIESLKENITSLEVCEEKTIDKCNIYYEAWQLQCCGKAFSVGDIINWKCVLPQETKNAHGIIIDFEEEHHGFSTHHITGTITKITAERSEFQKGNRCIWYHRAPVIRDELQYANGRESVIPDDENTEHMFWGYIVELKDVVVKPIEKERLEATAPASTNG